MSEKLAQLKQIGGGGNGAIIIPVLQGNNVSSNPIRISFETNGRKKFSATVKGGGGASSTVLTTTIYGLNSKPTTPDDITNGTVIATKTCKGNGSDEAVFTDVDISAYPYFGFKGQGSASTGFILTGIIE